MELHNEKKMQREEKGITLIALIVTIVVLAILAGVSISVLVGDQGIIRKTQSTSEDAEKESVREQALIDISSWVYDEVTSKRDGIVNTPEQVKQILESENSGKKKYYKGFTDEGVETPNGYIVPYEELYNGGNSEGELTWDEVLENATTPHPSQTTNTIIGVGTDKELVNMDYWRATKVTIDGVEGYGLYSDYNSDESSEKGYISTFSNGKIKGAVPQYIKKDGDTKFYPVISMGYTFAYCYDLEIAPEIPTTVKNMNGTFLQCTRLKSAPTIPESVKCMNITFSNCSSLTGEIIINATPSKTSVSSENFINPAILGGIYNCFYNASTDSKTNLVLKGSSSILDDLVATKGTSSNISKGN